MAASVSLLKSHGPKGTPSVKTPSPLSELLPEDDTWRNVGYWERETGRSLGFVQTSVGEDSEKRVMFV